MSDSRLTNRDSNRSALQKPTGPFWPGPSSPRIGRLCSCCSGVTCHPSTRCRRQRDFDLSPAGHFGRAGQDPEPTSGATTISVAKLPHNESGSGRGFPPDSGQHPAAEQTGIACGIGTPEGPRFRKGSVAQRSGSPGEPHPRNFPHSRVFLQHYLITVRVFVAAANIH
jgi:hypothetical protein